MDNNLNKVALDLYGKIQTRFPDIKIGDEHGGVLSRKSDIPDARFFEFKYTENGELLGTVAITLDQDDGVVIQVSGDLTTDTNHNAYRFIRSFRQFAKSRLLQFDVQNIGKRNLDKRDYQFKSTRKEEPIMENKMFGTAKISYQNLGEARLIVKHSQPINQELAAGRTMHIEHIYVENSQGERFKYPYKHLPGARALAEHVKHGGNPYDSIGKHITSLSEELAQLRKFKGYVSRTPVVSESMGAINGQVIDRIDELKKQVQQLQRPAYYETFAESFEDSEYKMIPEDVMTDWVDRLTIRTFNEDLKSVFPFIYRLVGESGAPVKTLSADDLLGETSDVCPKCHQDPCTCKKFQKDESIEYGLESFIESIVNEDKDELFSPNLSSRKTAINKLNKIMQQPLLGGPQGVNAIQSLRGIIDNPNFTLALKHIDPNLDVRALIEEYILEHAPEVAVQLHFSGDQQTSEPIEPPAPIAPPAPIEPPAPEMPPEGKMPPEMPPEGEVPPAPIAEGIDKKAKIKAKFIKVKESGATLDTPFAEGMTVRDAIKECGMEPGDCGFADEAPESGVDQILKSIAGFWNKEAKNFTIGGTRAKSKIIKAYKDGEYGDVSEDDVRHVLKLIEKMDPSSEQQDDILKLAGMQSAHDIPKHDGRIDKLTVMVREIQPINESLEQIRKYAGLI
jgi:hypothetical protein